MNKQVYDYLNSVRILHWRWLRLKSKHDELENCLLPAAIRYDKDKVQSSPEDTISKLVAEISLLETKMNEVQIAKAERIEMLGMSNAHPLEDMVFEISYVISGWGLKNGYVVFGIKEKEEK